MAQDSDANETAPRRARDWWRTGDPFPWAKFYWGDWLKNQAIRRLTPDERGRFADVWALTHGTDTPGVMTETDVRLWAGYTKREWETHREAFEKCFDVTRQKGKWRLPDVIESWKAGQEAAKIAHKRARKAAETRYGKLRDDKKITATSSQQALLDEDTEVQKYRSTEIKKTDVPEAKTGEAGRGGPSSALPDGTTAAVADLLERALGASSVNGTDGTIATVGGGS